MGFMDALRTAERKSKQLTRQGAAAARNGKQSPREQAQRRLRQKMRVYPDPSAKPDPSKADRLAREMDDARHRAIVSVHGEDVDEKDLGKRRKIA